MADITKLQDLDFIQLSTPTNGQLSLAEPISASDTTFTVSFAVTDEDGSAIVKDFFIELTSSYVGKLYTETMLVTSITGNEFTVVRGIDRGGLDYAGNASNAIPHSAGTIIKANLPAGLFQSVYSALQGGIGSTVKFASVPTWMTTESNVALTAPVYANSTARDAGITAPANGMKIYNTADGVFQKYEGGAWVNEGSATTPNGSTAVAGKFEEATQAEIDAATAVGGTGADLVVNPASLATSIYGTRLPSAAEKTYLTDLQSSGTTVTEIDQALDGISANVTAANLNTLTGGGDANALHIHPSPKVGRGTASATGDFVVNTLTFTPRLVEITYQYTDNAGNVDTVGWGEADATNNEQAIVQQNANANTYSAASSTNIIISGGLDTDTWSGNLTALASNGFTIALTKTNSPSNITINWKAFT